MGDGPPHLTAPDELLLQCMAGGDVEAFTTFVRRFQARVYGLAIAVVGDPGLAEEVTQDAFMLSWRHAARYDPRRGRVVSWLLTITRNLAVDAVRLRRDHPVDPERLMLAMMTKTVEPGYERAEHLRSALRSLPEDHARLIVLAMWYGLTVREIADQEQIPLGTAKTRIRRGLARLREAMGATDG